MGLLLFRDFVVRNGNVSSKLKHILLENVQNERQGMLLCVRPQNVCLERW
jgi:hypothetical protein